MTADVELPAILRDIAAGRRNSVGDYWSRDYCNQAAAEIEALRVDRDSFKQQAEHNLLLVERLAEALRHLRNHASVNSHQIELIDAALRDHDQEGGNP